MRGSRKPRRTAFFDLVYAPAETTTLRHARWAGLPQGAVPLENPLGGAPGFRLANVYVLPGLPSEMEAMFDAIQFIPVPDVGTRVSGIQAGARPPYSCTYC